MENYNFRGYYGLYFKLNVISASKIKRKKKNLTWPVHVTARYYTAQHHQPAQATIFWP